MESKKKIVNFESRQCLLNILKKKKGKKAYQNIVHVLKNVSNEISEQFYMDDNVLVIITDTPVSLEAQNMISSMKLQNRQLMAHIIRRDSSFQPEYGDWHQDSVNTNNLLKKLPFYQENLSSCSSSQNEPVYDECLRECRCINGKLVKCYRVRKHFSSLSLNDRLYIIDAYTTLTTNDRYHRQFFELLYFHALLNFTLLHVIDHLLPFHRRYTLLAENMYRLVDCRLTIPYWNFAINSNHLWSRAPSYHIWDDIGGFGSTNTTIENGFCVETGYFNYRRWKLPEFIAVHMNKTDVIESICTNIWYKNVTERSRCMTTLNNTFNPFCSSRHIAVSLRFLNPTFKLVYEMVRNHTPDQFPKFFHILKSKLHAPMHNNLGGYFGGPYSSFNPEFLLFHSMLDGLWDAWQNKGPEYKTPFANDTEFLLIGVKERRYLYLDNDNLGECGTKIKYTNIFPHYAVKEMLNDNGEM